MSFTVHSELKDLFDTDAFTLLDGNEGIPYYTLTVQSHLHTFFDSYRERERENEDEKGVPNHQPRNYVTELILLQITKK